MGIWNCLLFLAVSALFGVTVLSQTTAPSRTTGGAGGAVATYTPAAAAASRAPVDPTCALPDNERVDCGWVGVTKQQCIDKSCCWVPTEGVPWCYSRPSVTAGPVAETTHAEQTTIGHRTPVEKVTAGPSAGDTEGTTVGDVADTTQAPAVAGTVGMTTGEDVAVTTAPKTEAAVSTAVSVAATTEALTEELPVTNATEVEVTNGTIDDKIVDFDNLTDAQEKGIVTIEFKFDGNLTKEFIEEFDLKFRALVARKLNELPPPEPEVATTEAPEVTTEAAAEPEPTTAIATEAAAAEPTTTTPVKSETDAVKTFGVPIGVESDGAVEAADDTPVEEAPEEPDAGATGKRPARVRRSSDDYTADDVFYVEPTPQQDPHSGNLQSSNFAQQDGQDPVSQERLQKAMEDAKNSGEMETETGMPVDAIYPGMAQSQPPPSQAKDIWETHYGLFITIIILVVVCIIIIIIGLICLKCCQKDDEKDKVRLEEGRKQPPTVISNPIPDEEITRDEAPMVESGNPGVTPNGSGQHLRKDEDNGWVVPMDQLTQAERERPDVENTKL